MGEHQAFLCKQSGKIYWHSELSDGFDELPHLTTFNEVGLPQGASCSEMRTTPCFTELVGE